MRVFDIKYLRTVVVVFIAVASLGAGEALASDNLVAQRFIPNPPPAPIANRFIPNPSQVSPAPTAPEAITFLPNPPTVAQASPAPPPQYVAPPAYIYPNPPTILPAQQVTPPLEAQPADRFLPYTTPAPRADRFDP